MGNSDLRLTPNRAAVAAKVIDGEAIILDVTRGAYYSLDGAGAVIWTCIEQGHSVGAITRILGAHYEGTPDRLRQEVVALTDHLQREGLVIPAGGAAAPSEEPPPPESRQSFVPPQLHKYTDMGDLLALDPPMPVLNDAPADAQ
jgi:hypothetical protein